MASLAEKRKVDAEEPSVIRRRGRNCGCWKRCSPPSADQAALAKKMPDG
jgi:hypothetical protein